MISDLADREGRRQGGRKAGSGKEATMNTSASAGTRLGLRPDGPHPPGRGNGAGRLAIVQPVASRRRPGPIAGQPAVEIAHLRKTYGALTAVDDVTFSVAEGEIFGILGPNGAGKTTTVECAIGLRKPDAGTIRLLGLDPQADRDEIREIVGVQLQSSAQPDKLSVGEILDMYQSFYRDPADVTELLEALGLAGKRGEFYKSLSGGQRQRLSVALALIGRPRIAVLDEMTTGLDPQARREAWELIEGIRARGATVLLVTHFMEEAERLCDRVALVDNGRIVALGSPARLTEQARGGKTVQFLPSAAFDDRLLTGLPEVTQVEHQGQHVVVTGTGELVNAVLFALAAAGVSARDVQLDSSNLDDAFVRLTGEGSSARKEH
jgi:ABC-2 type transport system ATP-binding protein